MRQLIRESLFETKLQKIFTGKVFTAIVRPYQHISREYNIKFKVEHVNPALSFVVELLDVKEWDHDSGRNYATDWMFLWNKRAFEEDRRYYEGWIGAYLQGKIKSYFGVNLSGVVVNISNEFGEV